MAAPPLVQDTDSQGAHRSVPATRTPRHERAWAGSPPIHGDQLTFDGASSALGDPVGPGPVAGDHPGVALVEIDEPAVAQAGSGAVNRVSSLTATLENLEGLREISISSSRNPHGARRCSPLPNSIELVAINFISMTPMSLIFNSFFQRRRGVSRSSHAVLRDEAGRASFLATRDTEAPRRWGAWRGEQRVELPAICSGQFVGFQRPAIAQIRGMTRMTIGGQLTESAPLGLVFRQPLEQFVPGSVGDMVGSSRNSPQAAQMVGERVLGDDLLDVFQIALVGHRGQPWAAGLEGSVARTG